MSIGSNDSVQIRKVKNRGVLFTYSYPDWDLNLYLILGRKYNYIIDTGLGSLSVDPILKYIEGDRKKIIVVNSHYDWDHVWGNGSVRDSLIVSHKLCREMIQSKWAEMMQKNKEYCFGEVEMCLPNLVFEKELYFTEDKIRLIHTPGHTLDSISVLDEEDHVLFAGDNIGDNMDEIVPTLDCAKEVYLNTLQKYQTLDFDICLSGHNRILDKEVIGKILSMLEE